MEMNFSRNFTALRKKNNITQEQMAEKCGVSRGAIAKWETGSTPDVYRIDEIAKMFDITIDELLHGKMEIPEDSTWNVNCVGEFNEKFEKMLNDILMEVRKRDKEINTYDEYCKRNSIEVNDSIPVEAYVCLGNRELEKGSFSEALEYYEEAIIRGDIDSVFTVIKIYEDMIEIQKYDEDEGVAWSTRLKQARKMQEYGRIIEEVIRRGEAF